MKQRIDLAAEPRATGKHNSRALRNERKVPAIIYGSSENTNLWLREGDVLRYNVRAYENALFNVKSAEGKVNGKVVLMKEVSVHPVTRRPQHVDLFALDLTKPVRVSVEVRVEGKALGLADGGLLNVVTRNIEIECLPTEIPDFFKANVSNLGVGDALHVSDLAIPEKIKVITGLEQTIAVVALAEEEAAPAAAAATDATAAAAAPAAGAPAAAATPAAGAAKPAAPAKK